MFYMKNRMNFTVLDEDVYIDPNGDVYTPYDILNWQMNETGAINFVKVGTFNQTNESDREFHVFNDSIFWNNPARSVSE